MSEDFTDIDPGAQGDAADEVLGDILDDVDFPDLKGDFTAQIVYSDVRPLRNNEKIHRWSLKWLIIDEDSGWYGKDIWERFDYFPFLTKAELEVMTAREKQKFRGAKERRESRLRSLGVKEEDLKTFDKKTLVGVQAKIGVNTRTGKDGQKWTTVYQVNPIEPKSETIL